MGDSDVGLFNSGNNRVRDRHMGSRKGGIVMEYIKSSWWKVIKGMFK